MAEQDRDDTLSGGTGVRPMDQIGRQDQRAADNDPDNGDDVVGRADDETDDEFEDDDMDEDLDAVDEEDEEENGSAI